MSDRVQSVDRVFSLLECLADGGGSLTLSELAARSGLPMPTIHRLIRSLVGQGYVRQEASKRYAIGPRMIRLGESATRMLGSWAKPFLTRLVSAYGETSNLAMMEGDAAVYVSQVPSPQAMRMFNEIGQFVALHSTGVGKAMLSTMPDADVVALLTRTGMPARTEHTLTTPAAMLERLTVVRAAGYAIDEQEQELGVRCVAVPVTGLPFRAAVSVSGPSGRVTLEKVDVIAPDVKQIAAELARAFHARDRA
ncbi:MAG TPA: IclR family transcriptional regulator [Propionibacteriaceae bacterium]